MIRISSPTRMFVLGFNDNPKSILVEFGTEAAVQVCLHLQGIAFMDVFLKFERRGNYRVLHGERFSMACRNLMDVHVSQLVGYDPKKDASLDSTLRESQRRERIKYRVQCHRSFTVLIDARFRRDKNRAMRVNSDKTVTLEHAVGTNNMIYKYFDVEEIKLGDRIWSKDAVPFLAVERVFPNSAEADFVGATLKLGLNKNKFT